MMPRAIGRIGELLCFEVSSFATRLLENLGPDCFGNGVRMPVPKMPEAFVRGNNERLKHRRNLFDVEHVVRGA